VSEERLVLYAVEDAVATITLNRPEKLNALTRPLYVALEAALREAEADDAVRAIVLTGAGRAFSAGADLSGPGGLGRAAKDRWANFEANNARQFMLWNLQKPLLGAVHGWCLGRGCELALWCDVVIASEDARIGQPEIRDGSIVASIIPWLIGMQRAKLFMWLGQPLPAAEAERIGLIARVVPEGQALAEAQRVARMIAHLPPVAAQTVKRMVNGIYEQQGIHQALGNGALLATIVANLPSAERGSEELDRIRAEQGLKAYLQARDAPFRE
jgi:enoyl-CoA hydratase/carnithine racemase